MKYSSDKDFDQLIRGLVQKGYVYKTGKRHGKLYSPKGQFLASVPCTPSDCRALANFTQDLKRKLGWQERARLYPETCTYSNKTKGAAL